jgi:hypothetical protein
LFPFPPPFRSPIHPPQLHHALGLECLLVYSYLFGVCKIDVLPHIPALPPILPSHRSLRRFLSHVFVPLLLYLFILGGVRWDVVWVCWLRETGVLPRILSFRPSH